MPVAYMGLFAVFYQLGTLPWLGFKRLLTNAYLIIGSLGTMFILLALSFKGVWQELSSNYNDTSFTESLAVGITSIAAVYLLSRQLNNRKGEPLNLMGFVFVLFAILFFIGLSNPLTGVVLMNLLVLAAAVFTMQRGQQLNHLGILNYGLLIVALLVICRFFDTNISFVLRGLMFVAVGAGFFIANNRLAKKRKQDVQ